MLFTLTAIELNPCLRETVWLNCVFIPPIGISLIARDRLNVKMQSHQYISIIEISYPGRLCYYICDQPTLGQLVFDTVHVPGINYANDDITQVIESLFTVNCCIVFSVHEWNIANRTNG